MRTNPFSAQHNPAWRALTQAAGENGLTLMTMAQAKSFRKLAVWHTQGNDSVFIGIVLAEDLGPDGGVALYGSCLTYNPQLDQNFSAIERWAEASRHHAEITRRNRGKRVGGEELDPEARK